METHVQFIKRADGLWQARCQLIDGVEGIGETPEEAQKWYQHNLLVWMRKWQKDGKPVPIKTTTIDRPPLPTLTRSEFDWEGACELGKARNVDVVVATPLGADVHHEQVAAFERISQSADAFWKAVEIAIYAEYSKLYAEPLLRPRLPLIGSEAEMLDHLSDPSIYISTYSRNGEAMLGVSYNCTWDEEHGVGVMTNAATVLQVGGADTAFTDWVAEEHGGVELDWSETTT